MEKDFDTWNEQKARLHSEKIGPGFCEREIWFAAVGANVGFEQDGNGAYFLRPVLVVKKFNNDIAYVVPLTKSKKILNEKTIDYYFLFNFTSEIQSRAVLTQMRLMDAKRFQYKAGLISEADFLILKEKIRRLFA